MEIEEEEEKEEEKKDVSRLTDAKASHDEERPRRALAEEPRCALERSSRATELFVALTSRVSFLLTEWVRGRNEESRGPVEPGAGRGDDVGRE